MNKFWNMVDLSDDEAEITLYGDVCDSQPIDWWTGEAIKGNFITPEGFMDDLEMCKGKKKINVKLNSCGGDLYTGIAIHNALKGLAAKVNVIVEGIAASAASVIMCAGDTVEVYAGSIIMIHGVSVGLMDYYNMQDLKAIQKSLDVSEKAIAEIYAAKTGKEVDTLRSMITKETWMTGKEALEQGFADVLIEGKSPNVQLDNKNVLFVNGIGHDMRGFKVPAKFQNSTQNSKVLATNPVVDIKEKEENKPMKSVKELMDAYPQLVNEIVDQAKKDAIKAERERIKEIEDIQNSIQDKELVTNAKYGENPMTAQALAFEAMKKNAVYAAQFMKNQADDYQTSNAAAVNSTPSNPEENQVQDNTANEISAVIDAVKKIKGGK